ncbi:MAG: tRNA guanosine(34) transglycosylase Tgt [Alphaproteobacteria bacterium]|nr:tRNA guanosine(34) transglycosylase Tgt [Alphaproteobacteria bacterium]
MSNFSFQIQKTDGVARRGVVRCAHGKFETPAFMATATAATVKAMTAEMVAATGAELAICNTYHLMLRPGAEKIHALGGLHAFMNWPGPLLTDSGGFQVMSLAKLRKLDEEGVTFRSHVDGSMHHLTPERAMEIQRLLDSDITMAFDECTPFPATHEQAEQSMALSMRWAARCKQAFVPREGYGLFGIVQGSVYEDLRLRSYETLQALGFNGYGIGGLAVGEGQDSMFAVLDRLVPAMESAKPRYLMGVGTPLDIIGAVLRGVDMFDCVIPTRAGRTGRGFTSLGQINIKNACHAEDPRALDPACPCPTCTQHSRAYLHHLFRCKEILGPMLLTQHNLFYYQSLMKDLREAIEQGTLQKFAQAFAARDPRQRPD